MNRLVRCLGFMLIPVCLAGLAFVAGCERAAPEPEDKPAVGANEADAILMIALDVTGSYLDILSKKAFPHFSKAVDNFFRGRLGEGQDKIIIVQISGGVTDPLIWEGSPRSFRTRFQGEKAFKKFVEEKADRNGSAIHKGVADSLEYLLRRPGVRQGTTKTTVLLYTDFEDNHPNGATDKIRLEKALAEYGKTRGSLGAYWVTRQYVAEWEDAFGKSLKHYAIHGDHVEDPPFPTWSD